MKYIFSLALIFLATTAQAEFLGCFVEYGEDFCSERTIHCGTGEYVGANIPTFGATLGTLCNEHAQCLDEYGQLSADFDGLSRRYQKKANLEKKLRKACGKKCKRIK